MAGFGAELAERDPSGEAAGELAASLKVRAERRGDDVEPLDVGLG